MNVAEQKFGMLPKAWNEAASMIAAIWIGLILGVSFFATPIKFSAPGVGREQLLLVGQVTFQAFTWVEFAAFALLVGALLGRRMHRGMVIGVLVLFLFLVVQKFAVLPVLDDVLKQTVAGEPTKRSNLHSVYVIIEVIKLAILFVLSLLLRSERSGFREKSNEHDAKVAI